MDVDSETFFSRKGNELGSRNGNVNTIPLASINKSEKGRRREKKWRRSLKDASSFSVSARETFPQIQIHFTRLNGAAKQHRILLDR